MDTPIKAPPTARFENRFPCDEELTEAEREARRERTRRAAAAYASFKAADGERIVHRTPERLRAAVERRRQRIEALRAEPKGGAGENLYRPESDLWAAGWKCRAQGRQITNPRHRLVPASLALTPSGHHAGSAGP